MMNKFLVLLGFIIGVVCAYSRAHVESCSGCKLNSLPEVRKFVMDENVGALSFERVTRKFIGGHNPDIVFYNDQNLEEKRVDMSKMSFDQLVNLMIQSGFTRNTSGGDL